MSFIRRTTHPQTAVRRAKTVPDFTPIILAMHRKLFPNDWAKGNDNRQRICAFLNLLGLNGNNFPNEIATVQIERSDELVPFIRVNSNIVDIGGKLTKFIPSFSSKYYQMASDILRSTAPPLLKAYSMYFVANLSFQLHRLSIEELAFFHMTIFELAGNGVIGSDLLSFLQNHDPDVSVPSEDDFYSCVTGFPFPDDCCEVLRLCSELRRAKLTTEELTKDSVKQLVGVSTNEELSEMDVILIKRYYNRLYLNPDATPMIATVPSVNVIEAPIPVPPILNTTTPTARITRSTREMEFDETAAPAAKKIQPNRKKPSGKPTTPTAPITRSTREMESDETAAPAAKKMKPNRKKPSGKPTTPTAPITRSTREMESDETAAPAAKKMKPNRKKPSGKPTTPTAPITRSTREMESDETAAPAAKKMKPNRDKPLRMSTRTRKPRKVLSPAPPAK